MFPIKGTCNVSFCKFTTRWGKDKYYGIMLQKWEAMREKKREKE